MACATWSRRRCKALACSSSTTPGEAGDRARSEDPRPRSPIRSPLRHHVQEQDAPHLAGADGQLQVYDKLSMVIGKVKALSDVLQILLRQDSKLKKEVEDLLDGTLSLADGFTPGSFQRLVLGHKVLTLEAVLGCQKDS